MTPRPPRSALYEDRGGVNWFLRSWAPLAHPAWLALWCVATLGYLFVGPDEWGAAQLGPAPWPLALLFTCDAAAAGAVLATGLVVQARWFTSGRSTTSPGAWLVWVAVWRMVLMIAATRSGIADAHMRAVWYAAISSLLFLVPIYFGPPLGFWQHRWVAVVAIQAAPLLVHVLLSLAASSRGGGGEGGYLESWYVLPDFLATLLLLPDARRRSRPFDNDEFHRAGLVIYATRSVVVVVIMLATRLVVAAYLSDV